LCDDYDGGSSSREEEGDKYHLESVTSFAQAHTSKETVTSFCQKQSTVKCDKQKIFNLELVLFPKCEIFMFRFLMFLT
jgi:hypothetical protein